MAGMRTTRVVQVAKSSKKVTDKTVKEDVSQDDVDMIVEEIADTEAEVETVLEEEPDAADVAEDTSTNEEFELADNLEGADLENTSDEIAEDAPAPTPQTVERKRGGFVPLVFGGLVAGGIGYGAETYLDLQQGAAADLTPQIESQAETIAALQAQLDAIPEVPDTSSIEASIAEIENSVVSRVDTLEAAFLAELGSIEERISDVEKRPSGDGTLSETAIEAYERELEALRADVTGLAQQAEEDLAATRAAAEAMEQDALSAARAAEARAAVNRVAVAVETGQPYEQMLGDLAPAIDTIPAALAATASSGVASQAALEDAFPPAARAALATARAEGQAGESGGVGSFLRRQFEVRSTTPREGTDPDAILSRAQAAVEEGRLADALAEIEALPEVARAELTDWTADAQGRIDALAAIAELTETLKEN